MAEVLLWIGFGVAMVVGLGPTMAYAVVQLREMQRIIDRLDARHHASLMHKDGDRA